MRSTSFQRTTPIQRFVSRVSLAAGHAAADGCFEWTGQIGRDGYGMFYDRAFERTRPAHRVAYEMLHGPIPTGMNVLHSCDNRVCVRVSHLSLGTQGDNARDMHAKGRARGWDVKTHCYRGHEFTPENTRVDGTERHCRKCAVINVRRSKERRAQATSVDAPRRTRASNTHCIYGHEYTPGNTSHVSGSRRCRTCTRLRNARVWREGETKRKADSAAKRQKPPVSLS